jgi:hypothetical protein
VEVDHGRAARAGAEDKAQAEGRIARRRQRRHRVATFALVAILLAGAAVLIDRTWFGPPSLAPGARHTATLRLVPGCPGQTIPELDFAGHHWWPEQDPVIHLPATGTLVIVRRGPPTAFPDPRATTARLLVGARWIDLYGGTTGYRSMECPIS